MRGELLVKNVRPMAAAAVDVLTRDGMIAQVAPGSRRLPGPR